MKCLSSVFYYIILEQNNQIDQQVMNSQNLFSASNDRGDNATLSRNSPAEFTLSYDQYVMLQSSLPKRYALLEYKPGKRNTTGSAVKYAQEENPNVSRVSGNFENTDDLEGRSKRPRPKKVDRFLENDLPQKTTKRGISQKFSLNLDQQMMQCYNILNQLKKHKSAYPFLQPVDPKLDGAYNYLDIIKQPMDLSTVETNLKNGEYQTSGQFHGDINKIWLNSYAYNQKTSPLYKLTIEMEKYYKHLCTNEGIAKKEKGGPKMKIKEMKQVKKDSVRENSQKDEQQIKEIQAKEDGDGDGFEDEDQFMYDK